MELHVEVMFDHVGTSLQSPQLGCVTSCDRAAAENLGAPGIQFLGGADRSFDHFEAGEGKHRAFYLVQQFIDGPSLADEMKGRRYAESEVVA